MTILSLYLNIMMLTDVQRRSFYLRVVLFNHTFYVQRWPRDAVNTQWSCGHRKEY